MNVFEAIEKSIEDAASVRSKLTARNYHHTLRVFMSYLKSQHNIDPTSLPHREIKMEYFIDFPMWIARQGYAKKSVDVFFGGVGYFMNWLVIRGDLSPTYTEIIRLKEAKRFVTQRRESKLPRFPRLDDVAKILDVVRQLPYDSPIKERNIAIIEFLASTGCRNDEICKLKIKDFTPDHLSAIVIGKGSKERRVFLGHQAKIALEHYWTIRKFSDPVHPAFARHDKGTGKKIQHITPTTVRNITHEITAVAGIENFTPHYFRHAFAIRMLRETGNLALVQDLLGHASPQATRVYAKIYPEDLQEAHRMVYG